VKKNSFIHSSAFYGVMFVLPALTYMVVFIGYPIIQNIILSFKNVDLFNFIRSESQFFVGLENYRALLADPNSTLITAVRNTLVFTIGSMIFQFLIGFMLALLFTQKFPGVSFFRGVTMISWVLPITATGMLFKFLFATRGGAVNQLLLNLHLVKAPVEWLLYGNTAMAAIVTANIWIGIPFNMILFITGLTTIPTEVHESAAMDGAGRLRRLFFITLPMIKPAIMSVLALGFVYIFKAFDLVWVMTQGGPINSTQMISTYSYRLSFQDFMFSRGAASANILFVILLVMGMFYLHTIDKNEVIQ
jgi:multiple sugar transport system permease protein